MDGTRTGRQTPLQDRQREPHAAATPAIIALGKLPGGVHARTHVLADRPIQFHLPARQPVGDGLCDPFGKQRLARKSTQILLDHAPHQPLGVRPAMQLGLVDARETVLVQQGHEQLEILLLARMRRRGHQQQVLRRGGQHLAQAEARGPFLFAVDVLEMRAHAVRLVHDRDVPTHLAQQPQPVGPAGPGDLVHAHDQPVMLPKRVA